jgi:hypothetical protein
MRKLFLGCIFFFCLNAVYAQAAMEPQEQNNMSSFGDIATLSQQIALSERKIQAVQLQNNLAALQEQQLLGNFPFKVQYIEGFNDTLYAVLVDDKGTLYTLEPGAVFADHYRIALIRPTAVGVTDLTTHRFYTVPFVIGGAQMDMNVMSTPTSTSVTTSSTSAATSPTTLVSK